MGRKLTPREREERIVEKIVKRIKNIEKDYSVNYVRRACNRYYLQRGNELKLKREIKEREIELVSLKQKQRK